MPWGVPSGSTDPSWNAKAAPACPSRCIPIAKAVATQPSGFARGRNFVFKIKTPADWCVNSTAARATIISAIEEKHGV